MQRQRQFVNFNLINIFFSFVNGVHEARVWTVDDNSEGAQIELVGKFIRFAEAAASRMVINPLIVNAHENLKTMKEIPPGFDKEDIFKLINHMKSYLTLAVYGYNSSRYDMNLIFDMIVKNYDQPGFDRKSVGLLKKGTAYFLCSFGNLQFKVTISVLTFNLDVKR